MARDYSTASNYHSGTVTSNSSYPVSMAVWVYLNAHSGNVVAMSLHTGLITSRLELGFAGGGKAKYVVYDATTGSVTALSATTRTIGQWHHICSVSLSSTSHSVFLDGGGKVTSAANRSFSGVDEVILSQDYAGASLIDAGLAWPTYWTTGLSDAEVAALANGAHPSTIQPEHIEGMWACLMIVTGKQ